MSKCAVLVGEAPAGFRQKKMEEMSDFLTTKEGGSVKAGEYIAFPDGVTEEMLKDVLSRIIDYQPEHILLYFCTKEPVRYFEKVIWCGGEEIQKETISLYQKKANDSDIDMQFIFDVCRDCISEEERGYEEV